MPRLYISPKAFEWWQNDLSTTSFDPLYVGSKVPLFVNRGFGFSGFWFLRFLGKPQAVRFQRFRFGFWCSSSVCGGGLAETAERRAAETSGVAGFGLGLGFGLGPNQAAGGGGV